MFRLKMKIGKQMFEVESNDPKTLHKVSSVYGTLPSKCDACGSEDIYLSWKNPQGNDYYMIACKDCQATQNFHQRKEGGFYTKPDDKMSVYKPPQESPGQSQGNQENQEKEDWF